MSEEVFANIATDEETVGLNGQVIIGFPWPIKRLTIMNDGPTDDLQWKFKEGHDWATLKPDETISLACSITQVVLLSSGAKYRVWGIG